MRRWALAMAAVSMVVGISTACTPTVPPLIHNYTCHAGGSWDLGTTPIAGFMYGVKDNGLAFSSNNGTCTGPNPNKITFVQVTDTTDPILALDHAITKCVGLGYTDAGLISSYPTLPAGVYECI
jgi:hypothetical protein